MAHLGSTTIPQLDNNAITGTFEGGCLGYWNSEYLLLDSTPTRPRIIRLQATTVPNGVPTLTALSDFIELPPSPSYFGIGTVGGTVVILREKGVLCQDGKVAVAELLSIDISSGSVLNDQEIYSQDGIKLLGGLSYVDEHWRFLGRFDQTRYFYEVNTQGNADIREIADYAPTVANRTALTYDQNNDVMLVVNGGTEVLAYNPDWSTTQSAHRIALDTANNMPVGIVWTGNAVAVLNSTPFALHWYGDAGTEQGGTTPVMRTGRRQLEWLDDIGQTFYIGATSFKGLLGETVSRIPVNDGTPSLINIQEKRITPEFVIDGARVGMEIRQGTNTYKITGIFSVGDNYGQSFAVS